MVGIKWKARSKISIGRVNIPFLSISIFSNTCGIGRKGASSIKIAATTIIVYGILSRNVHIEILMCNGPAFYGGEFKWSVFNKQFVKFLKNVFRLYLLQNIVRIFQYEVWHVILRSQGSRFKGSGFRVQRFRVLGSGFWVQRLRKARVLSSRIQDSWFKGSGLQLYSVVIRYRICPLSAVI